MPRTKPPARPKRVRDRSGSVMVEFSPEERLSLERLCKLRRATTGEHATLAGTIRYLVRTAAQETSHAD